MEIQQHCNDQVMKLYNVKKKKWAADKVSHDQMYQVFQCFSEDQVNHYEKFEFAILERRIDELGCDKSQMSYYTSNDITLSSKSDSSVAMIHTKNDFAMREFMKQKSEASTFSDMFTLKKNIKVQEKEKTVE